MRLFEVHEKAIQNDLREWAAEHAKTRPDIFELLPADTDTYPYQKLSEHTINGELPEGVEIDDIASSVEPRYPAFTVALDKNEQAIANMGETLDSLQNVIFASDHDELIDIALLLVRIRSNLQRTGYSFDTGLIANKMITYLGVKMQGTIVPATDLLSIAFDYTYLNLPRTQSGKEKISAPHEAISAYNKFMIERGLTKRLKVSRKLGRAMLIGAAITGTVNKPLDFERYVEMDDDEELPAGLNPNTIVIGRANQGVLKVTKQGLTYIGSAHIKSDDIKVTISENPIIIRSSEKLDQAMEQITELQSGHDPAHDYVYDRLGNLPVRKALTS